jgi:hypothetical protein
LTPEELATEAAQIVRVRPHEGPSGWWPFALYEWRLRTKSKAPSAWTAQGKAQRLAELANYREDALVEARRALESNLADEELRVASDLLVQAQLIARRSRTERTTRPGGKT